MARRHRTLSRAPSRSYPSIWVHSAGNSNAPETAGASRGLLPIVIKSGRVPKSDPRPRPHPPSALHRYANGVKQTPVGGLTAVYAGGHLTWCQTLNEEAVPCNAVLVLKMARVS